MHFVLVCCTSLLTANHLSVCLVCIQPGQSEHALGFTEPYRVSLSQMLCALLVFL
jgi:hypothetical protein